MSYIIEEYLKNLQEVNVELMGLAWIGGMAAVILGSIMKNLMTKAGRQCGKYKGNARKACFSKFKKQAYLQAAQKLSGQKGKCAKTKDPKKCQEKIEKKIADLKRKAEAIVLPYSESQIIESIIIQMLVLEAEGMEGLPKGWTQASVKKFAKSLTGKGAPEKGFFDKCVEKMKGKIDDPQAFCASVKDEVEGSTYWRGKGKTEKEAEKQTAKKQNVKQD